MVVDGLIQLIQLQSQFMFMVIFDFAGFAVRWLLLSTDTVGIYLLLPIEMTLSAVASLLV